MTALPASSSFTGASVTEGQFKAAVTAQRDYLAGLLGADGTIATALAALGASFNSVSDKTAAYTITVGDRGRLVTASGAGGWTLALPAAATAGAGFSFPLWNGSTGTITIDPSGSQLVNSAATLSVVSGSGGVVVCTGTAWFFLPTGRPVTQSAVDTTAGRLLKVGDFGLGTSRVISDFTAAIEPGFYHYSEVSAVGAPGASAFFGYALVTKSSGGGNFAIASRGSTNPNNQRVWFGSRAAETGAFTWVEMISHWRIIGTVSQVAGLPTGALIEAGSNANGEYVRFADGTQKCWRTLTASSGAGSVWTFPAAFSAAPVVTGSAVAAVSSALVLDAAPGTTAVTVSARDKTDARRADVLHLTAIGRWF